ncbi:AraC family transcriptional regulator [Vibrio sp. S17_S38]|uniref:AraC family transcriptional regulator n=1 Tax=Vibrio sp. S17_S38 TaxID=2720229 RepID=UPI0016809AC0|nr:AraC family transcriptional regulator [Vibrio sp. S17_S38]MBD1572576.1 AraC family transcriptional regulator [Vibrio sp. S17_S38]
MHLVRSGAATQFEQLVLELNKNPIQLMHKVGLRQAQFRDPNTYLAYPKLAELFELAATQCQCPLFGIELAQRQTQAVLGDLPMLVSRMETIEAALDRANEYLYLHASGAHIKIQEKGEYVNLALSINIGEHIEITQLIQLSVCQLAMFIASLLNIEVQNLTLYLCQSNPQTNDDPQQQKNLPIIHFDSAFNGIRIRSSQLSHRNHQDEEALNHLLESHLHDLQSRYPEDLTDQVKNLIRHLLPTGECCIERIASALGLHQRSLQNQLKNAHKNYRGLLQETRQEIAQQELAYGTQTITELALQLGYADIAVFSRHFKSWTGLSPRLWRNKR